MAELFGGFALRNRVDEESSSIPKKRRNFFFKNLFGIRNDVRVRDYQGFFQIQDNSSEIYKILFSIFVVNWFLGTMLKAQINGESGYESGGKKFCEAINRQGSLLPEAAHK
jgi:hypothetical protein